MSGNARPRRRKPDRRVRRTRNLLGDALMVLIQEKSFDAITVQELLDRAGVGRSTFYEYFRDKNDLFVSDLDEFLEHMATALVGHSDAGDRVVPVRELFGHVGDSRQLYDALVASGKIHDFLDLGRAHFARRRRARARGRPVVTAGVVDRWQRGSVTGGDGRSLPRDRMVGGRRCLGAPRLTTARLWPPRSAGTRSRAGCISAGCRHACAGSGA